MQINLEKLNIALEAMDDKPISKPRTPKFEGTEEKPAWGDVDKTFGSFLSAYYKRTNKALPKDLPGSFKECSEEIRIWMAEHSILGNPKSDSFDDGVVLPVVNPKTGKLNKGGVTSAKTYAGRVKGVSDATIRRTKELLSELYNEHFKKEESSTEGWFSKKPISKDDIKKMSINRRIALISKYWDQSEEERKTKKVQIVALKDAEKLVSDIKGFVKDLLKIDTGNPKSKETAKSVKDKCEALLKKYKLDTLISTIDLKRVVSGKGEVTVKVKYINLGKLAKESTVHDAGYKSISDVNKLRGIWESLVKLGDIVDELREDSDKTEAWDLSLQDDDYVKEQGYSVEQVERVAKAWEVHTKYSDIVNYFAEKSILPWPVWPILDPIDDVVLPSNATEVMNEEVQRYCEDIEVSEEGLKELQKYLKSESKTIEEQVKKSAELLKTEIDENVWRNSDMKLNVLDEQVVSQMVSLVISYIDATEWIDEYIRSYRVDENIEQLSIEFKKFFTINEEGLIEKEKVPMAKEQLIVDEAGWTIEAIAHHQKMMDKIAMEVDKFLSKATIDEMEYKINSVKSQKVKNMISSLLYMIQILIDKVTMQVDVINKHHEQILTKQVDEQMSQ